MTKYSLVGHYNYIGSTAYPGMVVPILSDGHNFFALYEGEEPAPLGGDFKSKDSRFWVRHSIALRRKLDDFDHTKHGLFAFSKGILTTYPVQEPERASWFKSLVEDYPLMWSKDPHKKASLALSCLDPFLYRDNVALRLEHLSERCSSLFVNMIYPSMLDHAKETGFDPELPAEIHVVREFAEMPCKSKTCHDASRLPLFSRLYVLEEDRDKTWFRPVDGACDSKCKDCPLRKAYRSDQFFGSGGVLDGGSDVLTPDGWTRRERK